MDVIGKKRLGTAMFKNLVPDLPFNELLHVEYRISNNWKKLIHISDPTKKEILCNLCNVKHGSEMNLYAHIRGKKHFIKMNGVQQLYHEKFTIAKKNINNLHAAERSNISINSSERSMRFNQTEKGDKGKEKSSNNSILINPMILFKENSNTVTDVETYTSIIGTTCALKKENEGVIIIDDELKKEAIFNDNISTEKIKKCVQNGKLLKANHNSRIADEGKPFPKKRKNSFISNVRLPSNIYGQTQKTFLKTNCTTTNNFKKKIAPFRRYNQVNVHKSKELLRFTVKEFHNQHSDIFEGLLGVEYVVKFLQEDNNLPTRFECILCHRILLGSIMQKHLLGYTHRLKYCEKYFPTAIQQYKQFMINIPEEKAHNIMALLLEKLAIAIECHHGRSLPFEVKEYEYKTNREEMLSKILSCRHASEHNGPTFTHIVDAKDIDKFIINAGKSPMHPSITFDSLDDTKETERNYNTVKNSKCIKTNNDYKEMRNNSIHIHSKRQKIYPAELHSNKKWTQRVEDKICELNSQYKTYRENPELHPLYLNEWEQFWGRRRCDLSVKRLSDQHYMQVEWVNFFNTRLAELYDDDVAELKNKIRAEFLFDKLDPNVQMHKEQDICKLITKERLNSEKLEKCEKPDIIAMLRILAALEEYLGSLGPKVVGLLSKSLQLQKQNPEFVNNIILTTDNCILFETIKEKFKGLLMTGILENSKQRILKNSIKEIQNVIDYAEPLSRLKLNNAPRKSADFSSSNTSIEQLSTATSPQYQSIQGDNGYQHGGGNINMDTDKLRQLITVYKVLERKCGTAYLQNPENLTSTSMLGRSILPNYNAVINNNSLHPLRPQSQAQINNNCPETNNNSEQSAARFFSLINPQTNNNLNGQDKAQLRQEYGSNFLSNNTNAQSFSVLPFGNTSSNENSSGSFVNNCHQNHMSQDLLRGRQNCYNRFTSIAPFQSSNNARGNFNNTFNFCNDRQHQLLQRHVNSLNVQNDAGSRNWNSPYRRKCYEYNHKMVSK